MYYAKAELFFPAAGEDLFERLWNLPETWVEPPNHARGGRSGVVRTTINRQTLYIKKQTGHLHRDLRHPLGQPTALRELNACKVFAQLGITTPTPLFCESRRVSGKLHTLLVTRELEGYFPLSTLSEEIDPLNDRDQYELVRAVAGVLAKMHRARWQHSALYPTHIFIRPDGEGRFDVALLDLEKVRRRLTVSQASRHDIAQFLRRRPCWNEQWMELFLEVYREELRADGVGD